MSSNIEKLGETLQGRMHSVRHTGKGTRLELAQIGAGCALVPDESPGPIPAGEYSICRTVSDLVMKKGKVVTGSVYMEDIHYEKLKEGDRVLLAWCGSEPVVVDLIAGEGEDEDAAG